GAKLDWAGYHRHQDGRRIPLPTYPFERQRYWVDHDGRSAEQVGHSTRRRPVEEWFHLPSWRLAAPLDIRTASANDRASCLVFADTPEVLDALQATLRDRGADVVQVRPGTAYACDGRVATIDVAEPEHYRQLFAALKRAGCEPDTIVHALNVSVGEERTSELDAALAERNLRSVMYLVQAREECLPQKPLRLALAATHAIKILDEDWLRPEKALLTGAAGAISREFPHIVCKCIDIPPAAATSALRASCERIVHETLDDAQDAVIAYRGGKRWLRAFEPVRLTAPSRAPALLRRDGVYLITGGLGGIGLALAEHLAEAVQAKLVLVGRSGLPPRNEWQRVLDGKDERAARRIRSIQKLEALGSRVAVLEADVADPAQIKRAVDAAVAQFGAVHGVIHAAGVASGSAFGTKTAASIAEVVRPKIHGTLALHAALAHAELDFFLLCSSMNAIVGAFGMYEYCAANAFQDAFAARQDEAGSTRFIAIAWDAWRDVGMAADAELPEYLREQKQQHLATAIATHEGVEAFACMLDRPMPQWLVATKDIDELLSRKAASPAHSAPLSSGPAQPRPELANVYAAPRTALEAALVEVWQETLAIDKVGVDDSFFDLGGDSLLITRLFASMRSKLPEETRDLALKSLFEHSTVAAVAALLLEQQQARRYAAEAEKLRSASLIAEEGEI
ncbi:MAG TPA: SDR family NAD(P)-dependent oxidoreductase, partial [Rudaea sp.]|nr:SDR family NAD(P)-dependent oxidoreductase [Rudaea sp.]